MNLTYIVKTRVLELSVCEDFVIPDCVVLTQREHVSDRQIGAASDFYSRVFKN